jgi:hypothetical protein
MAVSVEEQVLRLQITVDDVQGMQVVESESDLGGVELSDGVGESLCIDLVIVTGVWKISSNKPETCAIS